VKVQKKGPAKSNFHNPNGSPAMKKVAPKKTGDKAGAPVKD